MLNNKFCCVSLVYVISFVIIVIAHSGDEPPEDCSTVVNKAVLGLAWRVGFSPTGIHVIVCNVIIPVYCLLCACQLETAAYQMKSDTEVGQATDRPKTLRKWWLFVTAKCASQRCDLQEQNSGVNLPTRTPSSCYLSSILMTNWYDIWFSEI